MCRNPNRSSTMSAPHFRAICAPYAQGQFVSSRRRRQASRSHSLQALQLRQTDEQTSLRNCWRIFRFLLSPFAVIQFSQFPPCAFACNPPPCSRPQEAGLRPFSRADLAPKPFSNAVLSGACFCKLCQILPCRYRVDGSCLPAGCPPTLRQGAPTGSAVCIGAARQPARHQPAQQIPCDAYRALQRIGPPFKSVPSFCP